MEKKRTKGKNGSEIGSCEESDGEVERKKGHRKGGMMEDIKADVKIT